jgi:hypothetical protein
VATSLSTTSKTKASFTTIPKEILSLDVYTNIRMFSIPLHLFHGGLDVTVVPQETGGKVSPTSFAHYLKLQVIKLYNANPSSVLIYEYVSSLGVPVLLDRMLDPRGNGLIVPALEDFEIPSGPEEEARKLILQPRHTAELTLASPLSGVYEEATWTVVKIRTSFETIELPLQFGKLKSGLNFYPAEIEFPPGFPGLVHSISVNVVALLSDSVKVKVTSSDPRVVPGMLMCLSLYFDLFPSIPN